MTRFLLGFLPGLLATAAASAADHATLRPNVIFILSDDVGIVNHSTYGGGFETPHVDTLAKQGLKFTHCYSTPLCGPSRFQALTGRYPFRTGHISNQSEAFPTPKQEVMISTVMKQAGYATLCIGKWGQVNQNPGAWGFDEYLTYRNEESARYWGGKDQAYLRNGQEVPFGEDEYLPDIQHQYMMDFIDRKKGGRFFIYYPTIQIHTPLLRTPDSKPDAKVGPREEQIYRDNVAYMDKLIGRLVAGLEQRGLLENTLIIYSGDNGAQRNFIQIETLHGRHVAGRKGQMNEGGTRVPLIAYWKGVTPVGKVLEDLTD
ncbi:MAG: sulfatase-like hydrolase/transferase, partial [Opitutaceae bacterium]